MAPECHLLPLPLAGGGSGWGRHAHGCGSHHPRPTVHSIWPCGSSVGRKTSLLLSSPNAERFIRMKCMFGHAMLISEISDTAASAASPILYRLSCTLAL